MQDLIKYQFKILAISKAKLVLSFITILIIPFLFNPSSVKAISYYIDKVIAIPAAILFSEITYIEKEVNIHEIIYCTYRKKTKIFIIRFCAVTITIISAALLSILIFFLTRRSLFASYDLNMIFFLESAFSFFSTSLFFGSAALLITNLTKNYFAGVGISIFLYIIMFYHPYFSQRHFFSIFTLFVYDIWYLNKCLYLLVSIIIIISIVIHINNFV